MSVMNDRLIDAARAGDVGEIKRAVSQDADVNYDCRDRYSSWSEATTAIDICCERKYFECIAYLLTCTDIRPPKNMHIHGVLEGAYHGLIQKMVKKGLDLNKWHKQGSDQITTHLSKAVKDQDINAVHFLLAQDKIEVNSFYRDINPLLEAFRYDDDEGAIQKLLLKNGADINAKNETGETILMRLAKDGNEEKLRAFLSMDPKWDMKDDCGLTFLHHAHAGVAAFSETFWLSKQVDVVTFSYQHGRRVIQDVFNFETHEKSHLVRVGMTGPVEAITLESFEAVPRKSLQMAFNEHVKRGGKTIAEDIGVFKELEKEKTSAVLKSSLSKRNVG